MATAQESKTRSERLAAVDVNELLPKCIKEDNDEKGLCESYVRWSHI